MSRLCFSMFVPQAKKLSVLGILSLVCLLLSWIFRKMDSSLMQGIGSFFEIVVLIVCFAMILAALFCAVVSFYHSFYSPRAFLIRTLPFSRTQVYWSAICSGTILIMAACVWSVGIGALMVWMDENLLTLIQEILEADGTESLFVSLGIGLLLQLIFYFAAAVLGIQLGFRQSKSKIEYSILFTIAVYFVFQLLLAGGLAAAALLSGFETGDNLPLETIETLMRVLILEYLLYDTLMFVFSGSLIRKRTDVDA